MMRFGYYAFKDGDSEEYQKIFKVELSATGWAFERTRELFENVAKDEAGSLSTAQGILLKSTDFLRRIIEPAGGQGGVTLSYLCPHCVQLLSSGGLFCWVSTGKQHCSWWSATYGEKDERRATNRLLVAQTGVGASRAKVS